MVKKHLLTGFILFFSVYVVKAQELNTGWKCQAIGKVKADGGTLSQAKYSTKGWLDATVPGTVLTTLINDHLEPDPFFGMNNDKIPDIYTIGRDHYTYWFVKDFKESQSSKNDQVWLNFRGVNYSCDVWLNGHKL